MIYKLKFKNFYSFKNEIELDFVVGKKAGDNNSYYKDVFGNRISKIMGVFGANASGKTNFLKAIPFIKWLFLHSFKLGIDDKILFKQFLFSKEKKPSYFEIEFSDNGKRIFRYSTELTEEKIISEKLSLLDNPKKEKLKFRTLFERKEKGNEKYFYSFSEEFDVSSDFERNIRKNVSVISLGASLNNKLCLEIVKYFYFVVDNGIAEKGKINSGEIEEVSKSVNFFFRNPVLKEKAENILKKFDFGLEGIEIEEDISSKSYSVSGKHKYFDEEFLLGFHYESTGTKNLFLLLRYILPVLENGKVVILDEIDSVIHPLIIPEIINLFTSKETNPKNAQIIFNSHNLEVLKELDKEQIVLIEKDENGISDSWKLSDIKGVDVRENYYAKYLSGAYGGIPNL
jgi:AAA15 family ATPase/GTPase